MESLEEGPLLETWPTPRSHHCGWRCATASGLLVSTFVGLIYWTLGPPGPLGPFQSTHSDFMELAELMDKHGKDFFQVDADANFRKLEAETEELSQLLERLRASASKQHQKSGEFLHALGSELEMQGNLSETFGKTTVKGRILEILNAFDGQVSPLTAAKLDIAVTSHDLQMLGFNEGDHRPSLEELEVRTLDDADGRRLRIASGDPWPGARIPFCFHSNVPRNIQKKFETAVHEWEKAVGCLNFLWLRRKSDDTGCEDAPKAILVTFTPGEDASFTNARGASTTQLNLQRFSDTSGPPIGIMIHELGHALGMAHEQVRPKRPDYVTVYWDNIQDTRRARYQFEEDKTADSETAYDILSIMHYSASTGRLRDFSKPGMRALSKSCETYKVSGSACEKTKESMGQRLGLTQLDADTVANLHRRENGLCKSSLSADFHEPYTNEAAFPMFSLRMWYPRTTSPFNTIYAAEIHPFPCKEAGTGWWGTTGGGQLVFHSDGVLRFHPGITTWKEPPGHRTWESPTSGAKLLCFQSDGNLVIRSASGSAMWASGTHTNGKHPRAAQKIMLFDRHWTFHTKLKYGIEPNNWSLNRFPPSAPSSIEIIPWNGCIDGSTPMTWKTPNNARLVYDQGNLLFFPAGASNPSWQTNTRTSQGCLEFSEQLIIWDRPQHTWWWRSGTYRGARSPHGAVKIIVFDHEWSMFDAENRAVVTYPPSTNYYMVH